MVFSSIVFLSIFLPAVIILYAVLPNMALRNGVLLAASLFFYAYGEPVFVILMIGSAFFNYLMAGLIQKFTKRRKLFLFMAVFVNLAVLCCFKYLVFILGIFSELTKTEISVPSIPLPVGISFFTFQAMSYVIDVYRGDVKAQKNLAHILLYISLFPQLIAGPIVKYHDVEREIVNRRFSAYGVCTGMRRFAVGLAKKVLIANYLGEGADILFSAPISDINIIGAWTGAIFYMLQIYFDFSGYSDMAIGIGRMFGFHFKENFNYPYSARSIQDFWRRWHISLSGWFREYLYIPLGGNRKGSFRTALNKIIVFACTGIWHGANLTFLFWGLYHGFFLIFEGFLKDFKFIRKDTRFFKREGLQISGGRLKAFFSHIYVVIIVMIGFVFFRADTISQGFLWIYNMATGFDFGLAPMQLVFSLLTPAGIAAVLAGIVFSIPVCPKAERTLAAQKLSWPLSLCLLLLCMLTLAGDTYNPFIYFRF